MIEKKITFENFEEKKITKKLKKKTTTEQFTTKTESYTDQVRKSTVARSGFISIKNFLMTTLCLYVTFSFFFFQKKKIGHFSFRIDSFSFSFVNVITATIIIIYNRFFFTSFFD